MILARDYYANLMSPIWQNNNADNWPKIAIQGNFCKQWYTIHVHVQSLCLEDESPGSSDVKVRRGRILMFPDQNF